MTYYPQNVWIKKKTKPKQPKSFMLPIDAAAAQQTNAFDS